MSAGMIALLGVAATVIAALVGAGVAELLRHQRERALAVRKIGTQVDMVVTEVAAARKAADTPRRALELEARLQTFHFDDAALADSTPPVRQTVGVLRAALSDALRDAATVVSWMKLKSSGRPSLWDTFEESLKVLSERADEALAAVRSAEETLPDAPD
jgi:hypothetical protein